MAFDLVFDVAREGYSNFRFPAIGFVAAVGGTIFAVQDGAFVKILSDERPKRAIITLVLLASTIIWTAIIFASTYSDYARAVNDLNMGRFFIVDGIVANVETTNGKRTGERITVSGQSLSYDPFLVTAGFRKIGVIRQGQHVKIYYIGNTILRLEIDR